MDHVRFNPTNRSQPLPYDQSSEAWLNGRMALIFSAYRRDDFQNPEVFLEQAKLNLRNYPTEIVERITDPVTGIQARSQWPPSLAEIVKACEAELTHREKISRYSNMAPPLPQLPGPKFSVAEGYEEMVKKHGRPFGPFEPGRQLVYDARSRRDL